MDDRAADEAYMRCAIEEAKKSSPVGTAFCVGAILVDRRGNVLSTGFSREIQGNTHAEECCILKLDDKQKASLDTAIMYTTMEPCGERLSGKTPCANIIVENRIGRVVFGTREPNSFVSSPKGKSILAGAGVKVDFLATFSGPSSLVLESFLTSDRVKNVTIHFRGVR